MLAISQEPLSLAGEAQFPLAPLPMPAPDAAGVELAASDAVRLFVERVRDADPVFVLKAIAGTLAHFATSTDELR